MSSSDGYGDHAIIADAKTVAAEFRLGQRFSIL